MRLPNAERAIIAPEKLRDYLLSPERSGGKAAFFERLGYTRADWQRLESDFRASLTSEAEEVAPTQFGRKFVIRAALTGASGATEEVLSVWIIRAGEEVPRFVTTYGGRTRR